MGANKRRAGTSRVETREELRQYLARLELHLSGGGDGVGKLQDPSARPMLAEMDCFRQESVESTNLKIKGFQEI